MSEVGVASLTHREARLTEALVQGDTEAVMIGGHKIFLKRIVTVRLLSKDNAVSMCLEVPDKGRLVC